MSDLTEDQLIVIRRDYLRDQRGESPTYAPLSQFNKATGADFFTNDQLKAFDDSMSRRFERELDMLEARLHQERIDEGDSDTDAQTKAAAERLEGRYRLIAAMGFQAMADDPGYRAAQTVKGSSIEDHCKGLRRQALMNFLWVGVSIDLER